MKKASLISILLLLVLLIVINVQAEFGTGWVGNFYQNRNFGGDAVTISNISGINFNWPGAPQVNGTQVFGRENNFSARFTSSQTFIAGTYRFDVAFDDELKVFINGQQVYADELDPGTSPKIGQFEYTFGTSGAYSITLEYIENQESAVVQFQWNLLGTNVTPGVGTVFPTLVPTGTAIPPLTANVSGVRGLAVRTGPYLGATMVTTAVPDVQYPVLAQNRSEDGVTWYKITVNEKTGWSSGRYLTFSTAAGGLPIEGSVFDTIDNAPDIGIVAAPRSIMNLRVRPSTRTAIIGTVPWGDEVALLGRTVQGGFDRWYQVRYGDQVGWIVAAYVSVNGNIRDVPVR